MNYIDQSIYEDKPYSVSDFFYSCYWRSPIAEDEKLKKLLDEQYAFNGGKRLCLDKIIYSIITLGVIPIIYFIWSLVINNSTNKIFKEIKILEKNKKEMEKNISSYEEELKDMRGPKDIFSKDFYEWINEEKTKEYKKQKKILDKYNSLLKKYNKNIQGIFYFS